MQITEEQRTKYNLNRKIKRLSNLKEARSKVNTYRAKNLGVIRQRMNNWYHANKQRVNIDRKNWRVNNIDIARQKERNNKLKCLHGITLEDYAQMYDEQWGMCGICGTPGKSQLDGTAIQSELLFVDHCHSSGKVRGLLCVCCNNALGLFKDNEDFLEAGINYLKYFNRR